MHAFVLLLAMASIDDAIAFLKSAEKKVAGQKGKCAIATQTKAARMQLELAREVKDPDGARSMAGGLRELGQEAKAGQCPKSAEADFDKAAAALEGQAVALPEEDSELIPEQPQEKTTPPAEAKPQRPVVNPPPIQKPFLSPATRISADLDTQVSELARAAVPGFKTTGLTLKGMGRRSDWAQLLEAGKCYAFIGVGSQESRRVVMSLWSTSRRRMSQTHSTETRAIMYHCPFESGMYDLQVKVKRDAPYAVGVYVR